MRELKLICPCCGRRLIISAEIFAEQTGNDVARAAQEFGIELGAVKGGEEIGD